jgi:O-acetyl-ADP-ribose deacetylase (regulator of RNase III)
MMYHLFYISNDVSLILRQVDVVVNATNHKDLDFDVVSRKLVQKAGRETIVNEYLQAYPDGIGVCDVAVTQPGNLMCKKIFHGCLFGWIMNGDLSLKVRIK